MLVLSRRCGESIVVDGDIRITIASVQGNKVRVAISAPSSVRVDRQEVHDRRTAAEAVSPAGSEPAVPSVVGLEAKS